MELGFELKETEYNFESAEIVLLNIDDRSLVTRAVTKSLDSFAYELDDDITAHYGEWRGQVRFEQAGEIYVSSPVKFRIENDLSNERPPQLSDVQSWVSLKRYADGLVDELKKAVLSVDGIEGTFNTNETARQNQFETAEHSRQTTFETNESERDRTFESNEITRQSQELEREKAEGTRQTTFTDNEAIRTETFKTNEATRQENETARQQAETQRASAESSRVSAEAQRKTDHANRSAELAGKADKVVLKNLIENGDFKDSNNDGVADSFILGTKITDFRVENNTQYWTSSGLAWADALRTSSYLPIKESNKYYISMVAQNILNILYEGERIYISSENRLNGKTSHLFTASKSVNYLQFRGLEECSVSYLTLIDLTDIFGAGNEPTKEEMDELIKITGYIGGEYALNSKDFLVWTLSLIRNNRNAITALGGTI